MNIAKWDIFEVRLNGPSSGNPFVDVELSARFTIENREVYAEGFYNGEGEYIIRLMPDMEGEWKYVTKSTSAELDGLTGSFICTPAREGVHGPVRVATAVSSDMHRHSPATRLAYADGTDYMCVGTTCYVWTHQGNALEEKTLETLSNGYFNKIRMCIFPKNYEFNKNEPEFYPFEGGMEDDGSYDWDFNRFDIAYWTHLEKRIGQLMDLGIEADLIIFHPYDRWGFSCMPRYVDYRYLRYLVARLSAFRNVWWSFANEYDLMPDKTMEDWDNYFKLVQQKDPSQHLRSIHNCRAFYDHSKPWVTHCSVQHSDMEKVPEWVKLYQKPVVIDECCYEGNIPNYWGSISAEEMVNRMWESTAWGGYAGHGETYLHPEDILWWAKGGELHGQSPERILFLRKIMAEMPAGPTPYYEGSRVVGLNYNYDKYLLYYGLRQSGVKVVNLPAGAQYKAEWIDAWNMTVEPVDGVFSGEGARIPMPSRSYVALSLTRI